MATTYYADNYSNPMPDCPYAGVVLVREFQFTVATAFIINDLVYLCPIPGASNIVVDGWDVALPDLDTGGTPTFQCSLGDEDTANRFIAASTWGQAAGFKSTVNGDGTAQIIPITYTANKNFVLKVTAAAQTAATSVKIVGHIYYHMVGSVTPVAAPA